MAQEKYGRRVGLVDFVKLKVEVIREQFLTQVDMLIADVTVVVVFLLLWLRFKNLAILVFALIYAFFMLLWHYNF